MRGERVMRASAIWRRGRRGFSKTLILEDSERLCVERMCSAMSIGMVKVGDVDGKCTLS